MHLTSWRGRGHGRPLSFSCSVSGTRGNAPVPTHGSVGACALFSSLPVYTAVEPWLFPQKLLLLKSKSPNPGVTQNTGAQLLCLPLAAQGSQSPPSGGWGWGPLGCVPSRGLLGRLFAFVLVLSHSVGRSKKWCSNPRAAVGMRSIRLTGAGRRAALGVP